MRPVKEITADISALSEQIKNLEKQKTACAKELAMSRKFLAKQELLEKIGPLGVKVNAAKWKSAAGYSISRMNPHNDQWVYSIYDYYILNQTYKNLRMNAHLIHFGNNKWGMDCFVGDYAIYNPKPFSGDRKKAEEWGKRELINKLLAIKKKLQKELDRAV